MPPKADAVLGADLVQRVQILMHQLAAHEVDAELTSGNRLRLQRRHLVLLKVDTALRRRLGHPGPVAPAAKLIVVLAFRPGEKAVLTVLAR